LVEFVMNDSPAGRLPDIVSWIGMIPFETLNQAFDTATPLVKK
jgi:hypothetical protein